MLFLAVFCGFMAENMREHIIEHKRTKLYAKQFYEELVLDTTKLSQGIFISSAIYARCDSILAILKKGLANEANWKELYYQAAAFDVYNVITFHDASFEQIKNSGSLRFFTNDSIVFAIQEYINAKDYIKYSQTGLTSYYDTRVSPFVERNFDKELLYDNLGGPKSRVRLDSLWDISSKPILFLSFEKNAATEFKNMVTTVKEFYTLGGWYADLLYKSTRLIELLKKEYHLK
jgi:hypothetical protein